MNKPYSTSFNTFEMYAHQQRVELLLREAEHERLVREVLRGRETSRRASGGRSSRPVSRAHAGASGWRSSAVGLVQRLRRRRARA
ncbi:hypothetical protein [Streptomyces profundus]|uniref:hypothetical protein n=1 Tax=Streptomyces profundus TaxID=2867410 RepID=UPI001D167DC2|nr:hypothetical protein [Streptomyces sp. MA3_2.13]UED86813.1 hypothetical protein K4G22_23585 [Streptomyces sp. MA3_2.13]